MGKMILCVGGVAEKPYPVPGLDEGVCSVEELCWYIHEHIYTLTPELFDETLAEWLKTECHLPETASQITKLLSSGSGLKELVACLLSSTNYDTKEEQAEVLELLDSCDGKAIGSREKQKADYFLVHGQYHMAARAYKNIISGEKLFTMQETEYGNLLHNYGIALLHISSLWEASVRFLEAYRHNKQETSLKYYLWTLQLSGHTEEFENAAKTFSLEASKIDSWEEELSYHKQMGREAKELDRINEMKKMKQNGMTLELEKAVEEQLRIWKGDFRRKMATMGDNG